MRQIGRAVLTEYGFRTSARLSSAGFVLLKNERYVRL